MKVARSPRSCRSWWAWPYVGRHLGRSPVAVPPWQSGQNKKELASFTKRILIRIFFLQIKIISWTACKSTKNYFSMYCWYYWWQKCALRAAFLQYLWKAFHCILCRGSTLLAQDSRPNWVSDRVRKHKICIVLHWVGQRPAVVLSKAWVLRLFI